MDFMDKSIHKEACLIEFPVDMESTDVIQQNKKPLNKNYF